MRRGIARYGREMVAIVVLVALAMATAYVILQEQRLRIPVLEERPFELRAELDTAQAVTPGQGQTVRVAGVRVGDVDEVELEDGVAVVTFGIERSYLPIYRDATVLMRPQTGLKDMFFELDPGSAPAGTYEEGETVPVSNTLPDINLDEVLAALDADSRAYLRLLAVGLGRGLDGRGRELGRALRAIGTVSRDLERLNVTLAERDRELATLVSELSALAREVGRRDEDVTELFAASNETLGALAARAPDLQRATAELPGTLATARRAFDAAAPFTRELGSTLGALRPAARRLEAVATATEELGRAATPQLRDRLRPLAGAALPVVPDLGEAAGRFAPAAPNLRAVARKLNVLGNMTAHNPGGAEEPGSPERNEGYLYWLAWFGHTGNSVFTGQDAHGVYRRLYLTSSCDELAHMLDASPMGPAIGGLITGLGPLFEPGGTCA